MNVDVAIIGAGTAGLTARRAALKEGASVVMIEGGPYGTTCARVGCMPSKLLIHPAEIAHEIQHSAKFGLEVDGFRPNLEAVMKRVQSERDRFVGFVESSVEDIPDAQKLRGYARFVDDTTLDVDGTRVHAKSVIIATGSRPWTPPILEPFLGNEVVTTDTFFEQPTLPQSVAVFGIGVIGLELGQALHRLGSRVVFLDPTPGFLMVSDPAIRESISEVLSADLNLFPESNVTSVDRRDGGLEIVWTDREGVEHTEIFEQVLSAAGRRPNLKNLALENTSITLDARGMPGHDDRTAQIEDLPMFIAGDACGHKPILHEAADEGTIAGTNAAHFPHVRAMTRRTALSVAFTDPQIALVGQRYADLTPGNFEVGEVDYSRQGRSRVMGKNAGKVRIYGSRRCGYIVGAELFGPRMEHIAHLLAWAVQSRMTVQEALEMPFYHPVVEEGVRTALRDLADNLKLSELPCAGDEMRDGPGA